RGERVADAIATINRACFRPHRAGGTPVLLAPTNARADAYNHRGLAGLPSGERTYVGGLSGEFDNGRDRLPVPETLVLKLGARVMAVRNDPARRWVNGSVGTVTGLADDSARVKFDHGPEIDVPRAAWETIRYAWDEA